MLDISFLDATRADVMPKKTDYSISAKEMNLFYHVVIHAAMKLLTQERSHVVDDARLDEMVGGLD